MTLHAYLSLSLSLSHTHNTRKEFYLWALKQFQERVRVCDQQHFQYDLKMRSSNNFMSTVMLGKKNVSGTDLSFNKPEVGLAEAILPFPMAVLCRENGLWPPIADPCRDIGLDAIEALYRKETQNLPSY